MVVDLYESPSKDWFEKMPVSKEYPRHWITTTYLTIRLSNGKTLRVKKGCIWDGSSIPKWLWWLFSSIDEGAMADFIHDCLWSNKRSQLKNFDYDVYRARLFADTERNEWRKRLAPKKKIKNVVTHFFVRLIGGFFYSRQFKIPN